VVGMKSGILYDYNMQIGKVG